MKLNNKVYDVLKWICMVVLPAICTLYAALSAVWGWPLTSEVTTTISAVDAFLGVLLGISTAQYNKTHK